MKAKDIVVGEHYAVGHADYPDRAIVLEVGRIERTVYSGSWGGHKSDSPAARIRELRRDGSPHAVATNVERVVPLGQVLHPWSEQVEINAQREADRICSEARMKAERQVAERLTQVLREAGVRASIITTQFGIEVRLRLEAAETLASLLENRA